MFFHDTQTVRPQQGHEIEPAPGSWDLSKPKLAIWGANATGHGLVIADAVIAAGIYEIAGFIDDNEANHGKELLGCKVLGGHEYLKNLAHNGLEFFFPAVGDNRRRLAMREFASSLGLRAATVAHPVAHISPNATVAEGAFVAAGAVIVAGAQIGPFTIVNTGATADHNCVMELGSTICPGVHLAGRVKLEEGAFVGTGASVIPDMVIGAWSVVGAGACVTHNVPPGVTVTGVPAVQRR